MDKMLRTSGKRCYRYWIISAFTGFTILAVFSPVYQPTSQREVLVRGWEMNVSRSTHQYVLPDNSTTVISVNDLCSPDLFLIVIVCSSPSNFDQRSAIRVTWASLADDSTRVAFLLGESDNSSIQAQVLEESSIYDDIIQEGFVDSYNNLTIKSLMMLKWVHHHCSSAQFLMKSDDDIYLNLPALVKALTPVAKRKNTLIGSLICHARPILDPSNKWYMPQYLFSDGYYPNYLSGTGYVMSRDVVTKLYKAALKTPILHLEDVYITGMCARVAGVRPLNHYGFFYQRRRISDSCSPSVFTNHRMSSEDLHTAFSYMANCSVVTAASSTARPSPHVHPRSRHISFSGHCR